MAQQDLNQRLCEAAEKGDVTQLASLLGQGADINGRHCLDGCRLTPLMKAASHGRIEAVRFLLEAGVDVALLANENKTAEEMARAANHPAIVALLQSQDKIPDKVIFYDQVGDRMRQDVYDFTLLERLTMIRQGKYGAIDTMTITGFSAIEDKSDQSVLRKAFNEHVRRGGKADEALVFPNKLLKNKLPRPES
jgi:hypothetical protein